MQTITQVTTQLFWLQHNIATEVSPLFVDEPNYESPINTGLYDLARLRYVPDQFGRIVFALDFTRTVDVTAIQRIFEARIGSKCENNPIVDTDHKKVLFIW